LQPEGASSSVGNDLLGIASQLMNHIHITHHSNSSNTVPESDPDYARHIAATALAAAEANGAIPPLSAAQRQAFQAALEEVARHTSKEQIDTISEPEDPAHWFEMSEEGADEIIIKPEFRSLFEQLATLNLNKDWGEDGGDKEHNYDSKHQGGDVGNISTSQGQDVFSFTSPAGAAGSGGGSDGRGSNYAEGGTERAERAAEAEYMNLEVNAFEPHAKDVGRADRGVIAGDAPSAGGGAQVAGETSGDEKEEKSPAADF
jgi:hypothetical protein